MHTIKLITYNLFEGAHTSYAQLVDFVKSSDVGILCLQEVNEWQNNDFAQLKDFAAQCGFSHYIFGDSNTEFKLATLSRYPITSQQVYVDEFWHSVIVAQMGGVTIVNLHLNPKWEGPRIDEVKKLLTLIDANTPTILVGDFNSLSKQDRYPGSLLTELQTHGITKFGRDELTFSVTDMLESAGFIDIAAKFGSLENTVPSAFNKDKNHEVPLRLDYVFASKLAAQDIKGVEIVKNETTDIISDHYPLSVNVDLVVWHKPELKV